MTKKRGLVPCEKEKIVGEDVCGVGHRPCSRRQRPFI